MEPNRKFTSGPEVIAYLIAHAIGYGITLIISTQILAPRVYPALVKSHQINLIFAVNLAMFVVITAIVLFGFLGLRRAFGGGGDPQPAAPFAVPPASAAYPPPGVSNLSPPATSGSGSALGIISIVCGVLGLLPGIGVAISLIGLVLGSIGRGGAMREGDAKNAQLCLIGIVLSAITLGVAAVVLVVLGSTLFGFSHF